MTDHHDTASSTKNAAHRKKKAGRKNDRSFGRIVERSTKTVERLHRAVASLPLDALERIDRFEKPVARMRKLQERSITARYEFVRGVTGEVRRLVRRTQNNRRSQRHPRRARVGRSKATRVDRGGAVATAS
jgi:hypothetical protein